MATDRVSIASSMEVGSPQGITGGPAFGEVHANRQGGRAG